MKAGISPTLWHKLGWLCCVIFKLFYFVGLILFCIIFFFKIESVLESKPKLSWGANILSVNKWLSRQKGQK
jgi:hypothetical protein